MKNKNLPLIIGVALPLIFIVVISAFLYFPSITINPKHDFIYAEIRHDYYPYNSSYRNNFKVVNGRITLDPVIPINYDGVKIPDPIFQAEMPILYSYDVDTDSSHEISFEEAQKLMLDPGPTSPDGYNVEYRYSHDGIFEIFGSSGNNSGYFITKGTAKKRIAGLAGDRYWYQGNFNFIGRIK